MTHTYLLNIIALLKRKKNRMPFHALISRENSFDARIKILPMHLSYGQLDPLRSNKKRCAMLSYFIARHPASRADGYAFQFADFQSSPDRAGWSPENWIRDGTSWDSRRSLRAILESLLLATASLSCSTKYTSAPFRARTLDIKSNQLTNFRGFRHGKKKTVSSCYDLTDLYTKKYK